MFLLPSPGMNAAVRAVVRMGIYVGAKVYFIHEVRQDSSRFQTWPPGSLPSRFHLTVNQIRSDDVGCLIENQLDSETHYSAFSTSDLLERSVQTGSAKQHVCFTQKTTIKQLNSLIWTSRPALTWDVVGPDQSCAVGLLADAWRLSCVTEAALLAYCCIHHTAGLLLSSVGLVSCFPLRRFSPEGRLSLELFELPMGSIYL